MSTDRTFQCARARRHSRDSSCASVKLFSISLAYHWRELQQVSFLSRQKYVCRDRHVFDATKVLWRQTKQNIDNKAKNVIHIHPRVFLSRQRRFVATNTGLSGNIFCRNKTFVATKMILVAAPANDRSLLHSDRPSRHRRVEVQAYSQPCLQRGQK